MPASAPVPVSATSATAARQKERFPDACAMRPQGRCLAAGCMRSDQRNQRPAHAAPHVRVAPALTVPRETMRVDLSRAVLVTNAPRLGLTAPRPRGWGRSVPLAFDYLRKEISRGWRMSTRASRHPAVCLDALRADPGRSFACPAWSNTHSSPCPQLSRRRHRHGGGRLGTAGQGRHRAQHGQEGRR